MDTSVPDAIGTALLGRTRGAVLSLLFGRPDEEFHVRQISRLSGASLGPVQRELKFLAELGILASRRVGHQLLYRVNLASPVRDELSSLVMKTAGMGDLLRAALRPLHTQIRIAFLFGSFAGGRQNRASDVDIMVVGDCSFARVARALAEPQRRLGREINPTVYRAREFAAKMRESHHFLNAVLEGSRIFLIGDEDELRGMAKERLAPSSQNKPPGSRRTSRRRQTRSESIR